VVVDVEEPVQKVVLKGGLPHPIHHADEVASAIVEVGCFFPVGVAGLGDQIHRAVLVLGDIPVLIGLLDEIAVAVVDQRLAVPGGVDLGLDQATVVVGVQRLLYLVHLVDLVDAPQLHLGEAIHLVVLKEAAVALAVYRFDDIAVPVKDIAGTDAVAVGNAHDAAILIIVECFGPVKGVGLADDAVEGVVGVDVDLAVAVGQPDEAVGKGFSISSLFYAMAECSLHGNMDFISKRTGHPAGPFSSTTISRTHPQPPPQPPPRHPSSPAR